MVTVLLVFCASLALTAAAVCIWAGSVPRVYRVLWEFRIPAVLAEIIIGGHSAPAALAAVQAWDIVVSGAGAGEQPIAFVFARPSDAGARPAFYGTLAVGLVASITALGLTGVSHANVRAGADGRYAYELLAAFLMLVTCWLCPFVHVRSARDDAVRQA